MVGGDVMTKRSSSERVLRMLAILPWVAAQPDGATIDELCERFQIDRDRLVGDLGVASMVGLAPFTADVMVEVDISDDRVHVNLPQAFTRPLRLRPDQGVELVARTRGLLSVPGSDPDGPLARGVAKLAAALGVDPDATVDVEPGRADPDTMALVQEAVAGHRRVELDYYSAGRDEHTHRVVDPYRVASIQGQWYVEVYCHASAAERLFRLDRISGAVLLDEQFDPPGPPEGPTVFHPAADDPRITIEVPGRARWISEQYPVDAVTELDDGRLSVQLTVSSPAWLERLLLSLGAEGRIVEGPDGLRGLGNAAATRVLARYRSDGVSDPRA